jgi:TetR/AcrR family transcriptional regulator, transcriptional repressor for nem operon
MLLGKEIAMNKGELTRQRIVEMAAPIFNLRGYAGCSMQDVMDATGLEKGGLYRHFTSKEELAAESFRYALSRAVKVRTEGLDCAPGSIAQLRCIVKNFVEHPSPMPGGCPILNTAIDADDGNSLLRKLVLNGLEDWKRRLAAIVEEGIRRREIRRSVESRWVANTMISALEGALMISRLENSRTALEDAQKSLESLFDAIASKSGA